MMNAPPDPIPQSDHSPPWVSTSRVWLHGYNNPAQLPQGVQLGNCNIKPGFFREWRRSIYSDDRPKEYHVFDTHKGGRPVYIGEFLNTCAMMHAFTIPPTPDFTATTSVLLNHIQETQDMKDKKTLKLQANSQLYRPLSTEKGQHAIRLVTILPSQEKMADIKCILESISLNQNPTYEALSYVWGNLSNLKQIDLSGHAFYVNQNLEVALRNLRLRTRPRTLWIDAICINQNDTVEKSNQVMRMGDVYGQAFEVLIWLGPETNSSAKAFHYLQEIILPCARKLSEQSAKDISARKVEESKLVVSSEFSDGMPQFGLFDQNGKKFMDYCVQKEPASAQYLEALCELLRRPWWSRIWVLQEIARSKSARLICGTSTLPWTEFCHALGTIVNSCPTAVSVSQNSRTTSPPQIKTATSVRNKLLQIIAAAFAAGPMIMQNFRERWMIHSRTHLPLLLFATQRFKSTDPRDKVYALLGLIRDDRDLDAIGIPDYDISPGALFTKVAKWLICRQQDLSLFEELHYFDSPPGEDLSLPSWVPDFRLDRSLPPMDGHSWVFAEEQCFYKQWFLVFGGSPENSERDWTRPYCAGLAVKSSVPFQFSSDDRILTVGGVEVDTIVTVLESCLNDIGACINGWKQKVLSEDDSDLAYKRGGTLKEAFWRTVLANINIWDYQITKSATLIQDRIDGVSKMPPSSAEDEQNILDGICAGIRGPLPAFRRQLFKTSSGLIGLGPETVKAGHIVTVLDGSRMCIILSQCQRSKQYRIVGER
jgi:hypothetical protein